MVQHCEDIDIFKWFLLKQFHYEAALVDECYPPKTQSIENTFQDKLMTRSFIVLQSHTWIKPEQLAKGQAQEMPHLSENMCLKLKKLRMNSRN